MRSAGASPHLTKRRAGLKVGGGAKRSRGHRLWTPTQEFKKAQDFKKASGPDERGHKASEPLAFFDP